MTLPRSKQISLDDTPYYHCISRCVRRAFLLEEDQDGNKSTGYRRQWVVDRLRSLSDIFAVEICAYCVLSNHTHVILRVTRNGVTAKSLNVGAACFEALRFPSAT